MSESKPCLIVNDAKGRRVVPIDKPVISLGRRTEADVHVGGTDVSRQHAEILTEDGVSRLCDKKSSFGTFVNGEKISEAVLKPGDVIRLGRSEDTRIRFQLGDEEDSHERSAVAAVSELRHMAGLLDGLHKMGSGRVLEDVLTLVVDSAIDVTGADRGFIMLANDEGKLEFKLARVRGHQTITGDIFKTSRQIPGDVFATGQMAIIEDITLDPNAQERGHTVQLGIRSVLCAPLRLVRFLERADQKTDDKINKIIGVLYLDGRERGALQSPSARLALETLSSEAAIAIENARMYREALERARLDQELKVAAAIQQSLLPAAGRSGTFFTTAGASVPCRSIGGDFFDYVDLSTGEFGFILGDVAGKGPPAGMLAAAALGMFGAEATYQTSAATLLACLNRGLFRRSIEARFLTTFYGILRSNGTLTYSNGGHNAPILVTRDGIRRLEAGGIVLGLFDHASYDEETLLLAAGDFIVAFSDGVSEALNEAGEEFTEERLISSIAAHRDRPPQELLDGVVADVRAFCGRATQSDDVTVVVVRYDGS
jgi:serine phosphatase RsbU (regulator of sigma subunit)/pSer/pThr/pTyr-binding forkhead associated (FHA) protein